MNKTHKLDFFLKISSFFLLFSYALLSIWAISVRGTDFVYQIISVVAVLFYLILSNVNWHTQKLIFRAESNFILISFFILYLLASYTHALSEDIPVNLPYLLTALGNSTTTIGLLAVFIDFLMTLFNYRPQ